MCSYNKKIIFLFLAFICFGSCSSSDDTWDIISVGLPKVISPKIANINMGLYILKQTHEPLLRYRKRTEIYSNLLESWSRNLEDKRFSFCLKKDLRFSDEKVFDVTSLEKYLYRQAKAFEKKVVLESDKSCIIVKFNQSQKSFLNTLTKYENAPSSTSKSKSWENGLGKYKIASIESSKINLERKTKTKDGYNFVNFWAYSGKDDPILTRNGIEDYNRVLIQDLPMKMLKTHQKFNVALLQTINLVLNVKEDGLRNALYNCINIDEFRQAFMPEQERFLDVAGVLPIGIPRSNKGQVEQKCETNKLVNNRGLKFFNWNKSSSNSLKNYFTKLKEETGIDIQVIDITMSQFVEMVLKSPHPYDLTVVALDAIDIDYDAYFSPIIDDTSILDVERNDLKHLYDQYKKNKSEDNIDYISSKILERNLLLPLYQEVRDFYFPAHVEGLILGKNDLEYLEISELRR